MPETGCAKEVFVSKKHRKTRTKMMWADRLDDISTSRSLVIRELLDAQHSHMLKPDTSSQDAVEHFAALIKKMSDQGQEITLESILMADPDMRQLTWGKS
jgi:hypothetical protein